MAQAGFTPISLYYSTTASAVPTNTNLVNGELAINITDGKLYYKNNSGVVTLLAQSSAASPVTTFSAGTTGFTPSSATSGAITLAGTLITSNGGTGLSSYTAGDLPYYATGTALSKLAIGTSNQILTSSGTAPQWTSGSSISVGTATNLAGGLAGSVPYQTGAGATTFLGIGTNGQILTSSGTAPQWSTLSGVAVTTLSFGSTGLTPSTATSGAITVAGTLATTNGGTGLTSFNANGAVYATSSSALTTGTLPVGSGGTGATTLTGVLKGNGTSAFTAATAGTDYVAPGTATTFTALQTFTGTSSNADLKTSNILEVATISATAATGTIAYDITTQSVLYYTSNASANWTVNFRGSSGTSLNTLMQTGESMSVSFLVTQGATAYYNSSVQVDGTTSGVTTKWQGSAPTSGNANSIDSYTYVIIKTANATFTVLAAQTKFA